VTSPRLRIGIVGCGDVTTRHYLPALELLADRVELVGCCDPRMDAAERVADAARAWSHSARVCTSVRELLAETRPDAVFNLTPAPLHGAVSRELLEGGVHVYSEKPIAATLAEADALIDLAGSRGLHLLCAPASATTARFRRLGELIASGKLGRPTLATGQSANMGPASWPEYTGDPAPFYGPGVGPVRDVGVYRLHEMTTLLGPVRRVSATGAIAIPERTVLAGPRAGAGIRVTSPDHVLINLEFASGALGQLLTSFAVPATRAPWLELQLTEGTISLNGDPWGPVTPADVYTIADGSWRPDDWSQPAGEQPLIGTGVEHFVACIRGESKPILTAEHARHVLEIILATYESIADGSARDLRTTF
jgi:predicted dehydrogenase